MTATNPQQPVRDTPGIWPKPPVVLILFVAAAFGLEHLAPLGGTLFRGGAETLFGGAIIMACGFAIAGIAVRTLIRAETTFRPDRSSRRLVDTGIFARTRNPIYVGFVLMMLGLGIMAGSIWTIVLTPVFMLYLGRFVIAREEAYLERRFGEDYRAYKRKVRRWF